MASYTRYTMPLLYGCGAAVFPRNDPGEHREGDEGVPGTGVASGAPGRGLTEKNSVVIA